MEKSTEKFNRTIKGLSKDSLKRLYLLMLNRINHYCTMHQQGLLEYSTILGELSKINCLNQKLNKKHSFIL